MTVTVPFKPKGEVAEWKLIFAAIKDKEINATISYKELDEALGRDFREDRGPLERAREQLEAECHRTLSNVRGIGYRVIEPREHVVVGRIRHKRARRQLKKAKHTLDCTDRSLVDAKTRAELDDLQARTARIESELNPLRKRVSKIEQDSQESKEMSEESAAKIADLTRRLEEKGLI